MTQYEKSILLKDLCARFPYGVKLHIPSFSDTPQLLQQISDYETVEINDYSSPISIDKVKAYLRPLSSMTEEEKKERNKFVKSIIDGNGYTHDIVFPHDSTDYTDWLNAHHFDYRGLIPKGLAIEAPSDMYNIKTETT